MIRDKVLSNNNYMNSVRCLEHFEGFGGNSKIRPDLSSQGRYVTAISMLDTLNENDDAETKCFDILNTIKQWDTRWQFVYDPIGLKVKCKTHCNTEGFTIGFKDLENTRHNRYSVTLFGGEYKMARMKVQKNREHLEYIHEKLKASFPGKEQVYEMMEEGEKSLRQE